MTNLNTKAWLSLAVLAIVMGLLLFVSAGTIHYWQAWVYLLVFTGTSALITLSLMRHDPALLERRMRGGPITECRPAQRISSARHWRSARTGDSSWSESCCRFWSGGSSTRNASSPALCPDTPKYQQRVRRRLVPFVW
jgi:hypothetical protein